MLFRTTGHCKQDWRLDPGGLLLTVASTRATPSAKKAHLSWCFHSRLQGSSEGTKTGGAFHREDVPPLPALGTLKKSHCAGFQSPSLVSPLPQDRVSDLTRLGLCYESLNESRRGTLENQTATCHTSHKITERYRSYVTYYFILF